MSDTQQALADASDDTFIIFNGPVIAGLSAMSDDYIHEDNKLILPPDDDDSIDERLMISAAIGSVTALSAKLNCVDESVINLACAVAVFAVKQNVLDKGSVKRVPLANCSLAGIDKIVKVGLSYKNAATIIAAAKVNYLHINHNVGDKGATQFFAKALKVLYPDSNQNTFASDAAELKLLWCVVHYPRSDCILKGLGQNGHYRDDCIKAEVVATDDLKIRLNGPVAGTTKWFVCKAIIDHIAVSAFGRYISWNPFYETVVSQCAAFRVRGIDAHVGRHVMSKHPIGVIPQVPDEELLSLAAIIHAIAPGSTLAKAKVLPDATAVAMHKFYNDLSRIKKSFFTQTVKVDLEIEGIDATTGFATGYVKSITESASIIPMYIKGDIGYVEPTVAATDPKATKD